MSVPTVTVLMAVYNGAMFLKPTIESILNQSFTDFEFLIVNDGSSDATVEIINSYNDSRIVLLNNERNLGQTKSLNEGLKVARGKYVARTDAGDVSLPERLERQVAFIENNPGISVLGTSAFRYDDAGKILGVVHMPNSLSSMLHKIFFASPIVHISVLMNRKIVLDLGGYDEEYRILADYGLWSKLIQNGYRLYNLKEVLVGYLYSPESFGAKNIKGRSKMEACKIIQSNARNLTSIKVSKEEALKIYDLFILDMQEMSLSDIIEIEKLYTNILRELKASKNDINYQLIQRYIKFVIFNMFQKKGRAKLRYAIKSIFWGIAPLLLYKKFYNDLFQQSKNIVHQKIRKSPYSLGSE